MRHYVLIHYGPTTTIKVSGPYTEALAEHEAVEVARQRGVTLVEVVQVVKKVYPELVKPIEAITA